MAEYTDSFDRADNADLGAAWRSHLNGASHAYQIIGNALASDNPRWSGVNGVCYDSATCSGQMFAEVIVGALGAGEATPGPAVCMEKSSTVGHAGYYAEWVSAGVILKKVGTTMQTIVVTVNAGDTVRLVATPNTPVSGTTRLQVFLNGGQVGSNHDDASPLSGTSIGLASTYADYTGRVASWRGGDGDGAAAAPDAPTGVGASATGATTASVTWTDASSNETGFDVQTAPSPYSSWTTAPASPAAANAASLSVSGLTAGTTYKARVRATNAGGSSAWVESGTFTTTTLTKKLVVLAHPDAAGATAVKGAVFAAPTGGALTGAKIGEFSGASFESGLVSGQARAKIAVSEFSGGSLTTSDTPVLVWEGTSSSSSPLGNAVAIGSAGVHECTVIEE